MIDVVIVGGGLFGQVIGKALRSQGRSVTMLDDRRPLAGSKPAACLIKPSWLSSMSKFQQDTALGTLADLYTIRDITFKIAAKSSRKLANTSLFWIDPSHILSGDCLVETVLEVRGGYVKTNKAEHQARLVVVCTGHWAGQLVPWATQRGLAGAAVLCQMPKGQMPLPTIRPWAPFKQLVSFDRGDGLWVGDGSSILVKNWNAKRLQDTVDRCVQEVSAQGLSRQVLQGIRPYNPSGEACLLREVERGLWVATGGAKNGTAAAGLCAHKMLEVQP